MLDPLGQSQVIPYLKELSKLGWRFSLLSYERAQAYTDDGRQRCRELAAELKGFDIDWHYLRYHRKPSLAATAYDVWAGMNYAQRLARSRRFELVHARSHIPATIALRIKKQTGAKMIFDIRGLMADEYVDARHWRQGSIAYKTTKRYEREAMSRADGVVTLTERIWPIISQWEALRGRAVVHEVIPCCADLHRFNFSAEARAEKRRELQVGNRFVLVYSGSIDGWYQTEEMADFFAVLRRQRPDAFFLWLTHSNRSRLEQLMQSRGIAQNDYKIVASSHAGVPGYLAAADAGLAFIKPCFSKLASSPTKYPEYLGCGLPLIINAGVGDSDALITEWGAGVLVDQFSTDHYLKAINGFDKFLDASRDTRLSMRAIAERLFDLKTVGAVRYGRLYRRVMEES